ncbi:MAG: flagellar M-ring protein FliF [Candidatus Omnitrophica bacterium]|nr:flagellar M-ring protein FliF [Candidatus Omnitrophota bacterium]
MGNFLLQLQSQFQKYWQSLSSPQKILVVFLSGLIIASLVTITFWATKPEYAVLFSNLSPQDASVIVNKLKDTKVPYRFTHNGDTILVPRRNVYELRIALAGEGLPQGGGVGFEIFDKSFFGMTEFTQKLNFQRALQGELERTIRQISGVEGVRVHLVFPREELFIEKEKEPSASVLIKMAQGASLNKSQVRAILNLVKTSVEGLKSENISIIDTRGNILSDVLEEGVSFAGSVSEAFQLKRKIEKDIQEEVRLLLEKIVGPGKVAVKANVELDLSRQETTKEEYSPIVEGKKGIVRSEQKRTESFKGSGTSAEGVPGVESNVYGIPGYAQSSAVSQGSDYTKDDTVINYEINKSISHILSVPGKIERFSISVLLDGDYPLQMLETIRQVVASGVGLQEARGDEIVVESFRFDKSYIEEEKKEYERLAKIELKNNIIKSVVIGFVCLIIFLFTLSMIRHAHIVRTATLKIKETQEKVISPPETVSPPPTEPKVKEEILSEKEREDLKNEIREIARSEPEKIAKVIKTMVSGG